MTRLIVLLSMGAIGCATAPAKQGVPAVIEDGSGIPIAMSPAALLLPGATRQLTGALAERNLLPRSAVGEEIDATVERALARFQQKESLPVTGLPSYQTVTKLGFAPARMFRPAPKAARGR